MPRCPDYLNPDDFDKLAQSLGISLTDEGVGALGEIVEHITIQLIDTAAKLRENKGDRVVGSFDIITAAKKLGVKVETSNSLTKIVKRAYI